MQIYNYSKTSLPFHFITSEYPRDHTERHLYWYMERCPMRIIIVFVTADLINWNQHVIMIIKLFSTFGINDSSLDRALYPVKDFLTEVTQSFDPFLLFKLRSSGSHSLFKAPAYHNRKNRLLQLKIFWISILRLQSTSQLVIAMKKIMIIIVIIFSPLQRYLVTNFPLSFEFSCRRIQDSTFGGWCAVDSDDVPYMQVDFKKETVVTALASQGLNFPQGNWVKKYSLNYSCDGLNWQTYKSFDKSAVSTNR